MSEPSDDIPEAIPVIDYRTNPAHGKYWWEGRRMAVMDGANLCGRCIQCGAEKDLTRHAKRFAWYPQWAAIPAVLLAMVLPIALIPALGMRRTIVCVYDICQEHRRKAWRRLARTAVLMLLSIGFAAWGMAGPVDVLMVTGGFGVVIAAILTLTWVPTVRAVHCSRGIARIRGVWPEFPADIRQTTQNWPL